jgi:hypothetical protein
MTSLKEKVIKIGAKMSGMAATGRLPDGRGRYSEKFVRQHSAADRRTAATASRACTEARWNQITALISSTYNICLSVTFRVA